MTHHSPGARKRRRRGAALVLAAVLFAAAIPTATATPPARRDFAFDWQAIREAARVFDAGDVARFEATVEELLRRPRPLIQPVPEPYVGVGLGAAEAVFLDAILELFRASLARGEAHKVVGFTTAFNAAHLAYAIESSRNFSGCILIRLTLEVSGRATPSAQPADASEGEYAVVVWETPRAPDWCRHHDRYSGYKGGYWRRATGVPAAAGTGPRTVEGAAPGAEVPRTEIADIQRALAGLGYRPGPIDGLMGRQTRDAIRRYQADHGLAPDGAPTAALREMLRKAPMGRR